MSETIKLDIDSKGNLDGVVSRIYSIVDLLGLSVENYVIHESNSGYHIRITVLDELSDLELVIIQLLMGSDPKREALNYLRVRDNEPNWNILHRGTEVRELKFSAFELFNYLLHGGNSCV